MEKYLFGGSKALKVEVQNHRKLVLVGPIKDVTYTLRILRGLFEGRTLGSITDAELIRAMRTVEGIKALKADSEARRRLCGK